MKPLFFIEIPALETLENQTVCCWYKQELTQNISGTDDLETIKQKAQACDVVLVLSGFSVLSRTVELKIKNRKQLIQALAYELEEQLATEVENLFFAYQHTEEKGFLEVAIINQSWFEALLDFFKTLQLELSAVVSDLILLKAQKLEWVVLQKNQSVLLKTPKTEYALDAENLSYFLKHLPEPLPEACAFMGNNDFEFKNCSIKLNRLQKESSDLAFLASSYQAKKTLNLLQGIYQPKAKYSWKVAQYSVLGVFILLAVFTGVEYYQHQQLQQKNQQLEQQQIQIYKRNNPNAKRIVNPLAQMRHLVATLEMKVQKTGELMPLLAKMAQAAQLLLQQQNLSIEKLEFQKSHLKLHFNAKSLMMAKKFKAQLKQQQLQVDEDSLSTKNNIAKGRYTLSE